MKNSAKVVLVSGKDPLHDVAGGHTSYVKAHARAAIRLGFEPHIFGMSSVEGTVESPLGIVHKLRSPYYGILERTVGATAVSTAPIHEPLIRASLYRFLEGNPEARLIHNFGPWGEASVRARSKLARSHKDCVLLTSVYCLLDHENDGKVEGLTDEHRLRYHVFGKLEQWWVNQMIVRAENRTFLQSDYILVNYESVRSMLVERFGNTLPIRNVAYSSETAFLAPDGSDKDEPTELKQLEPRSAPLIVSVSRHDPRKGLNLLLRSLAQLKELGIPFRACLVGWGTLIEDHRRLARELGLGQETAIVGLVEDPGVFLRHSDIFVLPSTEESSGSVSLIEALQAGLPCVVSAVDGLPEDVVHEESALLVTPGSVDSLTAALRRVLLEAPLRKRLADGALRQFAERFSAERFTSDLRSVYEECLS